LTVDVSLSITICGANAATLELAWEEEGLVEYRSMLSLPPPRSRSRCHVPIGEITPGVVGVVKAVTGVLVLGDAIEVIIYCESANEAPDSEVGADDTDPDASEFCLGRSCCLSRTVFEDIFDSVPSKLSKLSFVTSM
jgi:hypothetical protein